MPVAEPAPPAPPACRPRWGWEVLLVLGVSLGQSAVYSILSIAEKLSRPEPLGQQTTTINSSVTPDRPWLDLSYQLAGVVFPLVPALLALYLLRLTGDRDRIGFDLRRPWQDLGWGFAIAAGIGIPGLGLYFAARAFGLNTNVQPANLAENWWTIPVLVGLAVMNGVLEEVVIVGYWFTRMAQCGWTTAAVLIGSAVIRGSYHLYQGFGGFVGNLVMGLVFGWLYLRYKRVGPLVAAHIILDLFAFVGYSLIAPYVDWL
ncbi:CPBP family intramembrane glutamic endopeptidase [Micropruina sonneratiae]|uniref:CPBP family intramembrane glutamic endopeptidase n=1 Tax=Micropruina sonneratiae TaxID=2986940 RepID=UPI0022262FC5|nr:CPBP family intramembrane glutamic endopeptidase [Micropruina sp. KQZ13P-5]MCW3156630.1 CPBP family intramembrane metalloprotease [Micropruina sp. KQZ13P-5]